MVGVFGADGAKSGGVMSETVFAPRRETKKKQAGRATANQRVVRVQKGQLTKLTCFWLRFGMKRMCSAIGVDAQKSLS
jgi:hypothetical protein